MFLSLWLKKVKKQSKKNNKDKREEKHNIMNHMLDLAITTLRLDDMPSSDGIHLSDEQRLSLLKTVWENIPYKTLDKILASEDCMTSAEYCRHNGALCPHCRSTDIDVTGVFKTQDSVTWQPVQCNNCGKRWNDIRGLVGYEKEKE